MRISKLFLIVATAALSMCVLSCKKDNPDDNGENSNSYIENGKYLGEGIEIAGIIWAPVNCGASLTNDEFGLYYQWGRKDGQSTSKDWTPDKPIEGWTFAEQQTDTPDAKTFYWGNADWRKTLLAAWTDDPCPDGWRVPTYEELQKLIPKDAGWDEVKKVRNFVDDKSSLSLPAAFGYRLWYDGMVYYRDEGTIYWSSTVDKFEDKNTYATYIYLSANQVGMSSRGRGCGHCVRCVKK